MNKSTNDLIKQSDRRIFLVYALFLLFGIACIITILSLVIKDHSLYTGNDPKRCIDLTKGNNPVIDTNCKCFITSNTEKPKRGVIYDDSEVEIAKNTIVYDITIDGRVLHKDKDKHEKKKELLDKENEARLDSIIIQLADDFYKIFNRKFYYSWNYYKRKIEEAYKLGENRQIVSSIGWNEKLWIEDRDIDSLKQNPFLRDYKKIAGLNLTHHIVRHYPCDDLAKITIGRKINEQWNGLEREFNKELYGTDGNLKSIKYNYIPIPLKDSAVLPQDGANVHTTINTQMQSIAHDELLKTLRKYRAEWGCAVIMKTETGEIKAIANLTATDSSKQYFSEQNNYAVRWVMEPGSTWKLASLLAWLEKTKNDTTKQYPIYTQEFTYKIYQGKNEILKKYVRIDDIHHKKTQQMASPMRVFQQSSNVGMASMIFDAFGNSYSGFQEYLKMIDKMSITTAFKTQLGQIRAPSIKRNDTYFQNYYATCFGATFKMTPMQTLVYYNAIANNGKMVAPLFVKSISNAKGTMETFTAEVLNEQICSPATIKQAQKYLLSVVTGEYGTARKYKNRVSFAGKTGTRDVYDTQGYDKTRNSVSFCGYFPAEKPQYTCIVFIYNVREKGYIAAETFAQIAERIYSEPLPEIDKSKGKIPFTFHIAPSANAKTVLQNMGYETDSEEFKAPYVYAKKGTFHAINPKPKEKEMPDVKGMNAADAIFILNNAGYKVNITGRGIVRKQERSQNLKEVRLVLN